MSDRYAVERVKDRLWAVVEKEREGPPIGWSASETGARAILSLLHRTRAATRRNDARMSADPQAA